MNVVDMLRLDGRRAVVTGGSRGLGLEMARALGQAGAELIITSRDAAQLDAACRELRESSPSVTPVMGDLATPEGATRFCEEILANHAPVDILVNNVGGRRVNFPTEEMPLEDWQRIVDLNLTQAFICTKLIGGDMLPRRQGRVINVASISGFVAGKLMRGRSYETCKAALAMFTKAVAADWAPHNVTVNAIAPGAFLTDANRRWIGERPELKAEIEGRIPMGRMGDPHEIGALALYLASDASSYMTGSVVVIDGGFLLW
jgi:gluconate 5-dehydrogenase